MCSAEAEAGVEDKVGWAFGLGLERLATGLATYTRMKLDKNGRVVS